MFGLEFLFAYALWALPLAALPVVLHLLFRRKSPLVYFSTLRLVKSSIQHNAARKRVHRWLLLACRILLLALLIWAVAQPVRRLTGWFGGASIAAAIVVDTSYSMQLQSGQSTLLDRANDAIGQLLANDLQQARIAIFTSRPSDSPEPFRTAAAVQGNWRPLAPQPAIVPLVDRVATAQAILHQQTADHKWLFIISDLQRREFPHPLPDFPDGRTILIDLHPDDPRAAAISSVHTEPSQARLGVGGRIAVDLLGRAEDSRAVSLSIAPVEDPGTPIAQPILPMARLDRDGRTTLRVPYTFSAPSWLLLTAALQSPDALAWAASRNELLHIPSPAIAQVVTIGHANPQAEAIVRLALDPSEGSQSSWPITLRSAGALKGDEELLAVNLIDWPDEATTRQLIEHVRRGGSLVLFLQPGLEETWPDLAQPSKDALLELLPGAPASSTEPGPFHGSIARPDDPLLTDIGEAQSASGLFIQRLVPFDIADPSVQTILIAAADNPGVGSKIRPLLTRRALGSGQAYVWSTLPTPLYGNLATYELFLPILVNTTIRSQVQEQSLNVELGRQIVLAGETAPGGGPLDLISPSGAGYQVTPTQDTEGRRYVSEPANEPGLYTWKRGNQIVAYSNVQYPSAEAVLEYRQAKDILAAGPDVLTARSVPELEEKIRQANEPEGHWSTPIAVVLFLLCLEALLGSASRWRKAATPKVPSESTAGAASI